MSNIVEERNAVATQDLLPVLVHRLEIYQAGLRREGRKDRAHVVKTLIRDLERQQRIVDSILAETETVAVGRTRAPSWVPTQLTNSIAPLYIQSADSLLEGAQADVTKAIEMKSVLNALVPISPKLP